MSKQGLAQVSVERFLSWSETWLFCHFSASWVRSPPLCKWTIELYLPWSTWEMPCMFELMPLHKHSSALWRVLGWEAVKVWCAISEWLLICSSDLCHDYATKKKKNKLLVRLENYLGCGGGIAWFPIHAPASKWRLQRGHDYRCELSGAGFESPWWQEMIFVQAGNVLSMNDYWNSKDIVQRSHHGNHIGHMTVMKWATINRTLGGSYKWESN